MKKRVKSTADLPMKQWMFNAMYANIPLKFRDRQCCLTWTEVWDLIREGKE